jgi:hypothetical protein
VQQWPDTLIVNWDYPGATLGYEMRLWSRPGIEGFAEGAAVYGENGYVIIGNGGWRAHGPKGELVKEGSGLKADDDVKHKRDFLRCIRDGGTPVCDMQVGPFGQHRLAARQEAALRRQDRNVQGARGQQNARPHLPRPLDAPQSLIVNGV